MNHKSNTLNELRGCDDAEIQRNLERVLKERQHAWTQYRALSEDLIELEALEDHATILPWAKYTGDFARQRHNQYAVATALAAQKRKQVVMQRRRLSTLTRSVNAINRAIADVLNTLPGFSRSITLDDMANGFKTWWSDWVKEMQVMADQAKNRYSPPLLDVEFIMGNPHSTNGVQAVAFLLDPLCAKNIAEDVVVITVRQHSADTLKVHVTSETLRAYLVGLMPKPDTDHCTMEPCGEMYLNISDVVKMLRDTHKLLNDVPEAQPDNTQTE